MNHFRQAKHSSLSMGLNFCPNVRFPVSKSTQGKGKGKGKGNVKLSHCFLLTEDHAMKAHWGSESIAPHIL